MMQNQCNGGQCSLGFSHGWEGKSCGGCSCGGCSGNHQMCHMDKKKEKMVELMETVKCAKESLLKEKIKAKLEAKIGKKLDKEADMAVEILMAKWEMKKQKKAMKMAMMAKWEGMMSEGKK